jgi:lipopolysaccharide assembly protein A
MQGKFLQTTGKQFRMNPAMGNTVPYAINRNARISRNPEAIEMNIKLILGLIIAGMAIVFIIQNVTTVDLTFLFWTLSMSRALLMFLTLSLGITLGWLLHGSFRRIKSMPIENKAL